MEVQQEFKSVKDKVEWILEKFPQTRNAKPLVVVLYVWKYCDGLELDIDKLIRQNPSDTETIRRTMQKIQNSEGRLLPIPDVMERRDERQENIRSFISKDW